MPFKVIHDQLAHCTYISKKNVYFYSFPGWAPNPATHIDITKILGIIQSVLATRYPYIGCALSLNDDVPNTTLYVWLLKIKDEPLRPA